MISVERKERICRDKGKPMGTLRQIFHPRISLICSLVVASHQVSLTCEVKISFDLLLNISQIFYGTTLKFSR